MNIRLFTRAFFLLVFLSVPGQKNFYACHTKVTHTFPDYFGKYSDLIVVLDGDRQLEFTRIGFKRNDPTAAIPLNCSS